MRRISKIHARVNAAAGRSAAIKTLDNAVAQGAPAESLKQIFEDLDKAGTIKLPPNKNWDDAAEFYQTSTEAMKVVTLDLAEALHDFSEDKDRLAKCADPVRLGKLITQLDMDTERFDKELTEVFESHKDKKGGTVDFEDHTKMLQVNEQYAKVSDIFHTTVGPIVTEIHTLIGTTDAITAQMTELVEQRLDEVLEQRAADLKDPNVVSDAVITEVKPDAAQA